MHIASLNVNVLGRHFDEVQGVLVELDIHMPAQNETKLDGLSPNERPHIPSYQQVRNDRFCHGGGISIYKRDSIKFMHRSEVAAKGLELICKEIGVATRQVLYSPCLVQTAK